MWHRVGLTGRAMALVVLGLLLLSAAFGFVATWTVRESVDRSLQERLLLARVAASSIDHYNRGVLARLGGIASPATDGGWSLLVDAEVLRHVMADLYAQEVFVLGTDRGLVALEPPVEGVTGDVFTGADYVQEAFSSGRPQVSAVTQSPITGRPEVVYIVPVAGPDGYVVAAIGAGISLDRPSINGFIEAITLGATGYAQVVDGKGEVVASTQPVKTFGMSDHGDKFVALIEGQKAVVRTCHNCHETASAWERRRDVLAFAPLSSTSWGVAVRQAEWEALAPSRKLRLWMLGVGTTALLAAIAFTGVFMRRLLSPVNRLTEAARRFARGDLSRPVEPEGRGEIGVLAGSFEAMRRRLEASRQQIEERARDIELRNLELSALNSVATAASQSFQIDRGLGAVLERVLAAVGSSAGGIFLAQGPGKPPALRLERGLTPEQRETVARWEEPSSLPDQGALLELRLPPDSGHGAGPSPLTCVPLLSNQRLQGLLVLDGGGQARLEPRARDLLSAIGHQLAVALENASLFQETQSREREAQALYHLGVEILALPETDRILDSVVRTSRELLGADVAILSLLEDGSDRISIRAASGVREGRLSGVGLAMPMGFAGRVIEAREAIATEDYLADPSILRDQEVDALVAEEGLRSHAGAPLRVGERVIGALTVAHRRIHTFRQEEKDLLSRLANQAALAIENARLYEEVRQKEELRGQFLDRVISAQEEERRRIARELHDETAQGLTGLVMQLESMERDLPGELRQFKERLAASRAATVASLEEIRRLIADLRPTVLDDLGLVPAIRWYAADRLESQGVRVRVESPSPAPRLPVPLETALFRVVQEAINNIARHSQAQTATIALAVEEARVTVSVQDDGKGFRPSLYLGPRSRATGVGLLGMQERATLFGGTLRIDAAPGRGTKVTIDIPLAGPLRLQGPEHAASPAG